MAGTRSGTHQGPPPPPEPTTSQLLALIMEECQAHLTALQQLAANFGPNNNNDNNEGGNQRSTLSDFQKTNPPTFSKGTHPLEADDWLRTIENDLEVASVEIGRAHV